MEETGNRGPYSVGANGDSPISAIGHGQEAIGIWGLGFKSNQE